VTAEIGREVHLEIANLRDSMNFGLGFLGKNAKNIMEWRRNRGMSDIQLARNKPNEQSDKGGIRMKEDFSNEEWNNLLTLPYAVSITVIAAAPSFLGAWGESKAMMTEPGKLASASGSALVGLISTELQSRAKDLVKEQQILMKNDPARYKNETTQACKFAAKALSKVSPEEAFAYKKWIMAIGQKVAEAAKEHGVAVSEPEKIVLSEIKTALGL
jgi:hypothetical protein